MKNIKRKKSNVLTCIATALLMLFLALLSADLEKIDKNLERFNIDSEQSQETFWEYPFEDDDLENSSIEITKSKSGYVVKVLEKNEENQTDKEVINTENVNEESISKETVSEETASKETASKESISGENADMVSSDNDNVKIAYLTFDDGPSENTKKVLEILKSYDIKATFFLIGENINEDTKGYIDEMVADGHTIGIHTYSHDYDKIYASKEAFIEDFNKAKEAIEMYTGIRPVVYRFPGGTTNRYFKEKADDVRADLEKQGYICFDWNVSAEDSVGKPTGYSIMQNIKKDVFSYDMPVILMHDSAINDITAEKLPEIIQLLIDNGYSFDTLDNREQLVFKY